MRFLSATPEAPFRFAERNLGDAARFIDSRTGGAAHAPLKREPAVAPLEVHHAQLAWCGDLIYVYWLRIEDIARIREHRNPGMSE
jgi:hypothetical protein